MATGSPCFRNRWNRGIAGYISSIPSLLYRQCHECFAVFLLRLPFEKTPLLYPNIYDKYNALWIVLFYGVALCIARWFDDPYIHFSTNSIIGNWILGIILSLSDVMAVLFLCKTIKHIPFVSYFGRYSIIPLCTHHLVYLPLKYILIRFNISGGGILPIFTILICWACIPLCLKLIPWFIAQKDLLPNPMPIRTK